MWLKITLTTQFGIGTLGDGGEDEDDEDDDSSEGGHTVEEVAKHNKKGDVWVVLNGRILNVSNFLSVHPGGELAILTFAGKDAAAEFDMIHPPDVVEKYAPEAIFGVLGSGKAKKAKGAAKSAMPVAMIRVMRLQIWRLRHWRLEDGILLSTTRQESSC